MKQVWECEFCKVRVTLYVKPLEPPIHNCKKKSKRLIQLKNKEEEK